LHLIKLEKGGNETVEKMRGKKGKDLDVAFRWETADVVVDATDTTPAPASRTDEVLALLEDEPEDAEFDAPAEEEEDGDEEVGGDMVDEYDEVV